MVRLSAFPLTRLWQRQSAMMLQASQHTKSLPSKSHRNVVESKLAPMSWGNSGNNPTSNDVPRCPTPHQQTWHPLEQGQHGEGHRPCTLQSSPQKSRFKCFKSCKWCQQLCRFLQYNVVDAKNIVETWFWHDDTTEYFFAARRLLQFAAFGYPKLELCTGNAGQMDRKTIGCTSQGPCPTGLRTSGNHA